MSRELYRLRRIRSEDWTIKLHCGATRIETMTNPESQMLSQKNYT